MKFRSFDIRRNLQLRLLLIGSLPLLLITALLTAYSIHSRHGDTLRRVQEAGVRMIDYLSNTVDFALYSNNRKLLRSMADGIAEVPGVRAVAFLDRERRVMVASPAFASSAGELDLNQPLGPAARELRDVLVLERRVYAVPAEVDDYPAETSRSPRTPLGWVVVAMDLGEAHQAQRAIAVSSIGIGAGMLGTALLMALVLSRSVVTPIRELTAAVGRMQRGDLAARVQPTTRDELAHLAAGINHLADSVESSQRDLEQQIAHATSELSASLDTLRSKNRELEIAGERAEAANRAKTDFLARMSHELRTPLTSIQGFVRLLEQDLEGAADRNYCHIIDQASVSLLAMIDDILEFTKLQVGADNSNPEPFELVECIENCVQLLAPVAHAKGVELWLDIHPEVPTRAVGHAKWLRQILGNLADNAVKFTSSGHVLVRCVLDDSGALVLTVRDTGIGIDADQQAQIFAAFVQADTSIARRFGGTGLGLAITQRRVELLGGQIALHSTPGSGTEFQVTLPLTWCAAPPSPRFAGRALVYDPEQPGRASTESVLRRLFTDVVTVPDFDDLVDATNQCSPAALVFNWSLHDHSWSQVISLRHLLEELTCPVIVQLPLHALHEAIPRDLIRQHPHARWLGKPAGFSDIAAAIADTSVPAPRADLDGIRVLVAEDNDFSRLLLTTLLERTGCMHRSVADGRAAIAACGEQKFDVILMDVHMPETSGIAALLNIQEPGMLNASTPVVVLTADQVLDEGRELGRVQVARVLGKPYDERLLLETLLEISGRTGAPAPEWFGSSESMPRSLYFDEIERLVYSTNAYLTSEDFAGARETCHQLAGIVAVYRLGDLEMRVRMLHSLVRVGDGPRAIAILGELRRETAGMRGSVPCG